MEGLCGASSWLGTPPCLPVPGAGFVSGSPVGTWPTGFAGHPWVLRGGTARWSEPGRRDQSLPFPEPRQGSGRADKLLGHAAKIPPGFAAASHLSHPPFAPGKPQHPVAVPQQVWAQTLSFGRPTQRHVPFRDPPFVAQPVGWDRAELHIQGASSFLAVFSLPQRPRSRRGRRVPAGSPGHAAAQHRGLSLSPGAAGDRHTEPPPDPRVPPCPVLGWQRWL